MGLHAIEEERRERGSAKRPEYISDQLFCKACLLVAKTAVFEASLSLEEFAME